jgi:high-affinity Fe2+/Pb2+ permease
MFNEIINMLLFKRIVMFHLNSWTLWKHEIKNIHQCYPWNKRQDNIFENSYIERGIVKIKLCYVINCTKWQ